MTALRIGRQDSSADGAVGEGCVGVGLLRSFRYYDLITATVSLRMIAQGFEWKDTVLV